MRLDVASALPAVSAATASAPGRVRSATEATMCSGDIVLKLPAASDQPNWVCR